MNTSQRQEKTTHTLLAWSVTLTAALYFFYEFIQMNFFNAINMQLRETFQLDAIQVGQLFSMYFYANTACTFFVGSLLDRFSTRKLLLLAVFTSTLGTFIFAVTTAYWLAAISRFVVGMGASFCFLGCIRLASRWFPPHRMALVIGLVVTMAMVGGLIAQTPFVLLAQQIGWRGTLLLDATLGVIIFVVIIYVVQDRPPDIQQEAAVDQHQLKKIGIVAFYSISYLKSTELVWWTVYLFNEFTCLFIRWIVGYQLSNRSASFDASTSFLRDDNVFYWRNFWFSCFWLVF